MMGCLMHKERPTLKTPQMFWILFRCHLSAWISLTWLFLNQKCNVHTTMVRKETISHDSPCILWSWLWHFLGLNNITMLKITGKWLFKNLSGFHKGHHFLQTSFWVHIGPLWVKFPLILKLNKGKNKMCDRAEKKGRSSEQSVNIRDILSPCIYYFICPVTH